MDGPFARHSSSLAVGKRPSRLLNLNTSPQLNKEITADNASRSPLLLLPPEIRSRIWDFVFVVGTIHITLPERLALDQHRLSVCQCAEKYDKLPLGVHVSRNNKSHGTYWEDCTKDHRYCIYKPLTRSVLNDHLHLSLLRTCRQIYHEAVLKPFSNNTFQSLAKLDLEETALSSLLKRMVPAQIRAIKRLHLDSIGCGFPKSSTMVQLRGLEHLVLRIFLRGGPRLDRLEDFSRQPAIAALKGIQLKSLIISTKVQSKAFYWTDADKESLATWQKNLENELLDSSVEPGMMTRQQAREVASTGT